MFDREDCGALAQALDCLQNDQAGGGAWSALPKLAALGRKGHRLTIDIQASKEIGAPIVLVDRPHRPVGDPRLTPRQRQVARRVARGMTNKEIARDLTLSPATVKDHVGAILCRLNLKRRAQIAAHSFDQTSKA